MVRTKPWELSEEVWERARPLLPAGKPHPRGGRPRRNDRQMLGAILYVLRTVMQWNALPQTMSTGQLRDGLVNLTKDGDNEGIQVHGVLLRLVATVSEVSMLYTDN